MPGSSLRLLGLDPGLLRTGWGVIEVEGNRLRYVADGVVEVAGRRALAERLVDLFRQVGEVIARFVPDEAAVEESFVNKNPASTLKLGVARGVVLLAPAERGIPVHEYSANLIKKSVVGVGHADKAQVQMMVRRLLPAACSPAPTPPTRSPSRSATPTTRRRARSGPLPPPTARRGHDRDARRRDRPDRRRSCRARRERRRLSRAVLEPHAQPPRRAWRAPAAAHRNAGARGQHPALRLPRGGGAGLVPAVDHGAGRGRQARARGA